MVKSVLRISTVEPHGPHCRLSVRMAVQLLAAEFLSQREPISFFLALPQLSWTWVFGVIVWWIGGFSPSSATGTIGLTEL